MKIRKKYDDSEDFIVSALVAVLITLLDVHRVKKRHVLHSVIKSISIHCFHS